MTTPQFKSFGALMWVTDVPRAFEYYSQKLGMREQYSEHDDDGAVSFVIVERDGLEFHLQKCLCDDGRHTGNTFIEVVVDDVQALAREYESSGAEFESELSVKDWGSNCKVTDPDGNWIMFTTYN